MADKLDWIAERPVLGGEHVEYVHALCGIIVIVRIKARPELVPEAVNQEADDLKAGPEAREAAVAEGGNGEIGRNPQVAGPGPELLAVLLQLPVVRIPALDDGIPISCASTGVARDSSPM